MTPLDLYAVAGAVLFVAGLYGVLVRSHLLWKVLAVNVMAGGVFLILVSVPPRLPGGQADPVPQAMALTGIVVAVATTAVALGMALRVAARTGHPFLSEAVAQGEGDGAGDEAGDREGDGARDGTGDREGHVAGDGTGDRDGSGDRA